MNATTAFWSSEADLGGKVPFQISLACDETVDISQLRFSSVEIAFSDDRPDCVLKGSENGSGDAEPFIDLGLVGEDEAARSTSALLWGRGKRIVLNGQLQSDQEGEIGVSPHNIVPHLTSDRINQARLYPNHMVVPFVITTAKPVMLVYPQRSHDSSPRACFCCQVSLCLYDPGVRLKNSFVPRPIDVKLDTSSEIVYVGEQVPVVIKIRNDDDRRVYLRLSVFLPPGEEEQGV